MRKCGHDHEKNKKGNVENPEHWEIFLLKEEVFAAS